MIRAALGLCVRGAGICNFPSDARCFPDCIDLRDYSLYGASMRRGSVRSGFNLGLYSIGNRRLIRALPRYFCPRQFVHHIVYSHLSPAHRRSTCCVLAPVENDVRWCGCAPAAVWSAVRGPRSPLHRTPPSHRPALLTPTSPATGSGVRTRCVRTLCVP